SRTELLLLGSARSAVSSVARYSSPDVIERGALGRSAFALLIRVATSSRIAGSCEYRRCPGHKVACVSLWPSIVSTVTRVRLAYLEVPQADGSCAVPVGTIPY